MESIRQSLKQLLTAFCFVLFAVNATHKTSLSPPSPSPSLNLIDFPPVAGEINTLISSSFLSQLLVELKPKLLMMKVLGEGGGTVLFSFASISNSLHFTPNRVTEACQETAFKASNLSHHPRRLFLSAFDANA